jgi:hypothetical protein
LSLSASCVTRCCASLSGSGAPGNASAVIDQRVINRVHGESL